MFASRPPRPNSRRDDDIRIAAHERGGRERKVPERVPTGLRFDGEVRTLHVAKRAKAGPKRLQIVRFAAGASQPIRYKGPAGCPSAGSGAATRLPVKVARNARRSINGIMVADAVPFGRAGLRPLPDRPARTSAGSSGVAVSSSVALMKHGGLPGRTDSTGPRSAAAPSRARPNHRCRHTESDRPRALGASGRRPRDPRDERRRRMRRRLDAPGRTPGWSPAGDSRGSLGPALPGHGRAWRALS